MREWIAFPVITAHLPVPYFWLCCSETFDNGQTHPPFLLSHCWPLCFCKFLNHPEVSQFQFLTCSLCPPFTRVYRASAFPCLQTSLGKELPCSRVSWMTIPLPVQTRCFFLTKCLSPLQLPKLSIWVFKIRAENTSPTPQKTSKWRKITILQLYATESSYTPFHLLSELVWGFDLWSHLCRCPALLCRVSAEQPWLHAAVHICVLRGRHSNIGAVACKRLLGYEL